MNKLTIKTTFLVISLLLLSVSSANAAPNQATGPVTITSVSNWGGGW